MRINNPKSMAGYQRATSDAGDGAYNLATVGQVQTAVQTLQSDLVKLVHGENGLGASPVSNGYAWLNNEGKVDVSLLPNLAITETHTLSQTALKNASTLFETLSLSEPNDGWKGVEDANKIPYEKLLSYWAAYHVSSEVEHPISIQVGDVLIVNAEVGETPDPAYAGAYICTYTPQSAGGYFQFSRLSYTDGNIVKVNGKSAANSAGEVTIFLSDVLKERYAEEFATSVQPIEDINAASTALQSTVYRLYTINEGENGYRFGFVDTSANGQGAIVPYTKLAEFRAEQELSQSKFTEISGVIDALKLKHNTELAALESKHNADIESLSGTVDGKFIADVGDRTQAADSALSATLFAQAKSLRNDIDTLNTQKDAIKAGTNDLFAKVFANVANIHDSIDKRAVRMYMQSITWGSANHAAMAAPTGLSTASGIKGVARWTYTYSPIATGTSTAGDVVTGLGEGKGISNVDSQERVLAVYDKNGNLVNVDLNVHLNPLTGLYDTTITLDVDVYEDGEAASLNTLNGETWTLLIAKTISTIEIDNVRADI